jgi:putative ABC transport system substrate-binding protein
VERYSREGYQEGYSELARRGRVFKAVTDKIPVIGVMADPVAYGVVSNLARPGGNITGVSVDAGLETWAKRLQLLQEVVPSAAEVGYLNLRPRWRRSPSHGGGSSGSK